jgi:hypothetical protein
MATAESKMKNFSSGIDKVSKSADDFGSSLMAAIPVALIEEAIRRTGKWALELQRTSEKLGTNVEQTQQLRELFTRSGMTENDISTYFEKLEAAATNAQKGVSEVGTSLSRLGLTQQDLRKMPAVNMFEKIIGGGDLKDKGLYLEKVFGKDQIRNVQNLQKQFKAGGLNTSNTLSGFATAAGIFNVDEADVKDMGDSWQIAMQDFNNALVQMAPLMTKTLMLIAGLTSIIDSMISLIPGMKKRLPSGQTTTTTGEDFGEWAQGFGIGAFASFGRPVHQISGNIAGKITGTKAPEGGYAGEWERMLETFPSYRKLGKGSRAVAGVTADAALFYATGGGSMMASMTSEGVLAGASAAEAIQLTRTADKALRIATTFDKISGIKALEGGMQGASAFQKGFRTTEVFGLKETLDVLDGAKSTPMRDLFNLPNTFFKEARKRIVPIGITPDVDRTPIASGLTLGNIVGGGGPNLKFGGFYGADLQTRMTILTEQMRDYLLQIVQNTGGFQGASVPGARSQPSTEMH